MNTLTSYQNFLISPQYQTLAIIWSDATLKWYKDVSPLRDNDDTLKWYKHGSLHRDNDLPAIIWSDGSLSWCKDGSLHRDNGP